MLVVVVNIESSWNTATWAVRAGILTSLVCIWASVAGAIQNRRSWRALAYVPPALLGVIALLLGIFLEALSFSCLLCFI